MNINLFIKKYENKMMVIAGIASLLGIVLSKLPINILFSNVVFIIGMIFAGIPIFIRAYQGLRYKTVGIECLVSIAVIGACVIQEFSEAAIVTFLFQFGSYLEKRTMKKTRSAIKTLTEMAPTTAYKIEDTDIEEIDVDDVEIDDCLLVKTGNQIPVDGIVYEGNGYVNEASITGESSLSKKEEGSFVYAGSLLDQGTLKMKATKVGEDTTFSKIIALVEEAQDAKSPAERFIDRFARYYTPVVVLLSLLTFIFIRNLDTAITVLVLACPGALVIGAPIANVAGIGKGAQEGVLLKGGDSVNTFIKTDTMVFDKTGTLTYGKPEVIKTYFFDQSIDQRELLAQVAACEMSSDHPLGQAIVQYVRKQDILVSEALNVEVEKGYGIHTILFDKRILIGNDKFLEKEGIIIDETKQEKINEILNLGATVVLVALDQQVVLALGIADAIKEDAKASLEKLKKLGIHDLVMLTGDHEKTAKAVANQIGVTEYHGQLLPEDKVTYIKKMQEQGHVVTFVGDGINDSPALTLANIGIAMGSGTDVAIESSDVVLIKSDLTSLVTSLALAKQIVRVMYQNIAIAIGTVILLLIGLFAGYIHMAIGMLIHEASILVVIFNAMRLMIRRKENG